MKQIKEYAITPRPEESAYIKYRLELSGTSSAEIADELNVAPAIVCNVIAGRRHSAKIERHIAQVIGYPSWNVMLKTVRTEVA